MGMQTLTCYYIKIVEFNYDMPVFNQVTDGHICCYKLIIHMFVAGATNYIQHLVSGWFSPLQININKFLLTSP